jgi:S1-C subfamily serine protease
MLCLVAAVLLAQLPAAPAALEKKVLHATVRVYNPAREGGGTAVAIGREGSVVYLLTAAHVVRGAKHVEVDVFTPGEPKPAQHFAKAAVIAATDALAQDLALLRVVDEGKALGGVLPLRKAGAALPATPWRGYSAGCSRTGAPSLESEQVLQALLVRKPGGQEAVRCFKTKTPAVAGRSGGPLVHSDGTMLGIASGGDETFRYFIHVHEIRQFLKRHGLGFLAE